MIPITPEIIGPGIEEEYADALAAIRDMRTALGDHRLTNYTPEGRVLVEIKWLEQEIDARRLPIPVDSSYVSTVYYLVGSNEVANYSNFQHGIGRLWLVLKGYGIMKARHVPVLISMMDDFLSDATESVKNPDADSMGLFADMRAQVEDLRRGGSWPKSRPTSAQFTVQITPVLEKSVENCSNRVRSIQLPLFDGWRPRPARKPSLTAPVPGLPPVAPRLPPELEDQIR